MFARAAAVLLPAGCGAPRASVRPTPEASAVMAPVHRFVDGFNAGDTQAALAACTDAMSILDEFPPHEWHGSGALQRWFADYDADARRKGIRDGIVTLDEPRHVDIDGEYAYVVLPANYDFMRKGAAVRETGSAFTFALRRTGSGWRITGWSWARS